VIPVKDDIPTDRLPLITLVTIAAFAAAGLAFGGGAVPWVAAIVLLWFAGPSVEDAMGRGPYLTFVVCSGLIGFAAQLALDGNDVPYAIAAASGVVTAAAAAHVLLYPWARIHGVAMAPFFFTIAGVPLLAIIAVWVVVQVLVAALDWGDVPVAAQAAGVLWGLLFARLLARNVKTPDDLLQRGRSHAT
jgi:membrane associated rhomboid family serine protease